ncbi:collagen adhesion protein [Listeria grandensis FSL F6-0971]|uniref:Collagen adhesion protein n=1 Tax=Listeria grandensis FSL F6-0971 TaxID=1265819 RepID=W7BB23_9LIST|nr:SpaA isopeptide-forming pilin-related protein [Listeria grandensis]EUJ24324.1 collagen adhesion protein [Listeria grandensis FSL F6-0971]
MGKNKKYIACILIAVLCLPLFGVFAGAQSGAAKSETSSIQTSLAVATGTIKSREEVNLRVNISGSAGAFVADHGDITVTIPKEIVYNPNDFTTKTNIPQPFKLENVTSDATNYLLTFSVDRNAIGDNDAFNGIFEIKFGAPLMTVGDAYHDTQTFAVDYAGQNKQVTADVQKQNVAITPLFDKWYKGDFDKDGVATLNTMDAENNSFQLVVNYRRVDLKSVVITDTLPVGTSLIASPAKPSISGDTMTKDEIRILKVTAFDAAGTATKYEYVTAEFQDKIHVDKETNSFTVELGDLTVDDTYFIEYSLQVDDVNTGLQQNVAQLSASNRADVVKTVPVKPIKHFGTSYILSKSVDKTALNYDDNELVYTLKLASLDGDAIPAGTTITDPLDGRIKSPILLPYDSSKVDMQLVDNEIRITTLVDIPKTDKMEWRFQVNVEDLKIGDLLSNQAFLTVENNVIHSNAVSTRKYDGRISIQKVDNHHNPVAGAVYEVRNDKAEVVFDGAMDEAGFLVTKALPLGDYTVTEIEAPVGYVLDSTPHPVIVSDQDVTPIVLGTENKLQTGTVTLTKIDALNSENTLAGASFELVDQDGNVLLEDLITDETGKVTVDGLDPGVYAFVETAAPQGYILDKEAVPFEIGIGENDTAVEVVKENSHVFTPEPVLPEPEIPMPENKPEIPVKTPEAPVDKPILKPEITVPTGKPISKPEVTVPVEKPGMTDTPMIEPTVKPDTALKSDVKPMKLVKTGDQSEERFILLGGMLLLFGAVLLWYRKSVR